MANKLNKLQITLLIALMLLPLSATLIHSHVHATIEWVFWLTLFDTVIVTVLYVFDKTRIYAFWLNTLIAFAGIVYHAQFNFMGTLSDSLLCVADILIGYALLMVFAKGRKK